MSGWWTDRTDTERFDLYSRGSLYGLLVASVPLTVIFGVAESPENPVAAVVSAMLLAAATAIGIRVLGRGLDHAVHGTPVPALALRVYLTLAVAGGVAAFVGYGIPRTDGGGALGSGVVVVLHIVAVVSPLLGSVRLAVLGVGLAVLLCGVAALLGSPSQVVVGIGWGLGFGIAAMIGGFRGSVWMLRIVWELDRSRQVQADLAVAEERLRFSRDLHDVMGRDLSVIAVRSELAAELARRGRPEEAAEEMLGVRGVAQGSLREMREVVRGYRAVDLGAELAGARSVLRAAGTTTRVIGDAASLPPDVQSILAWVVREGTTNVIRHAEPSTCTFHVDTSGDEAVLTIENDGTRPPDAVTGTGLAGLTERLAAVGGSLEVDDDGGSQWFRLTARVPLTAAIETEPVGTGGPP